MNTTITTSAARTSESRAERSTVASVRWLPRPVPLASVQGTLALDLAPLLDPPRVQVAPGLPGSDLINVDPALRQGLEAWVGRYVQAVVEIVAGERPVNQVTRWCRREVYADLSRRAELVARAAGTTAPGRRRTGARPLVAGVRVCFLEHHVVEASARVRHGERSRALALRFDQVRDRWVCSALEFC